MNTFTTMNILHRAEGHLDVELTLGDGRVYMLAFYDAAASKKELDKNKRGFFAVPGVILLDKVSMKKIEQVIGDIIGSGYLDHLRPENGSGE